MKTAIEALIKDASKEGLTEISDWLNKKLSEYCPDKDTNLSEQERELMKDLGTDDTSVNDTDTNLSEQERELRNAILGGMKEGPDERW